jgi:hypothetical protein
MFKSRISSLEGVFVVSAIFLYRGRVGLRDDTVEARLGKP